ncbi:stathmin domain-containing protein 1 [Dunckerocampus dactyliophorus]|uniref:stathmin domain-containing protein 1 n=1 Tax=Dunckerocampus dactyliophorus TaxID=161453 RepID=UPI002404C26F|nr:stathmin domain-containing protein 1 [Dunckerocampus dactyliophorus]
MGCVSSNTTVVRPLQPSSNTEQDQTGSKSTRGDSAVSKVTEDSGVEVAALDNGGALPGEVPGKLPPPVGGGSLPAQERPTSSEILEELQSEGIIQVSPRKETSVGEAYTVMLGYEGIRRRPPARLESLRLKRLPSREAMEEKMRLADERRKLREDELTARLKSARVRRAATVSTEEEEDGEPGDPQQGGDAGDENVMEAASGELESNSSFQRGGVGVGQQEVF